MKTRYAFSMIELVFVIVVMGILASLAIPRMDRDLRQEAMDSIMSDLMLAQRMAVSDFRHDPNSQLWQKSYWKWEPLSCDKGPYYIVYSDSNYNGNVDNNESAVDSYNKKYLNASESECLA
ncbi:MAG: type II secretion system protein, partial [Campylobacterales bacterium]|nr:type II secretion system protein [Campylobacterales bacterium]